MQNYLEHYQQVPVPADSRICVLFHTIVTVWGMMRKVLCFKQLIEKKRKLLDAKMVCPQWMVSVSHIWKTNGIAFIIDTSL